jgi:hypothetical protein
LPVKIIFPLGELKELFEMVMDKVWKDQDELLSFISILTRRDMTNDETMNFHFGDFLKMFSGSHPSTQNSMHNMFLWGLDDNWVCTSDEAR